MILQLSGNIGGTQPTIGISLAKPTVCINMTENDYAGGLEYYMKHHDRLFNETWQQYKAAISRVVQSYEAIPALQEELQQDIAFAVWCSLPKFNQQSSLKTYILSIAHNRSISHVAKHVREGVSTSVDDLSLAGDDCPTRNLEHEQRSSRLIQGLRQLPIAQRQLIGLALEGLSYDDIAEILGITANNVGVRLNRAKKALKDNVDALN